MRVRRWNFRDRGLWVNDTSGRGDLVVVPPAAFDANYYASHCGPVRYDRSEEVWGVFFGRIADTLIRSFRPARAFDAGCALGFLVEAFWDRGVECWGRDISEYGISQVRADIRPFCSVGSIADRIDGRYDLVTCIEVVEHMPEAEAKRAIAAIANATDRVLFSSSPEDLTEPTHVTVRPPIFWIRLFGEQGFSPVLSYDATFVVAHTMLFERTPKPPSEEMMQGAAEIARLRMQVAKRDQTIHVLNTTILQQQAAAGALPTWKAGPIRQTATLGEIAPAEEASEEGARAIESIWANPSRQDRFGIKLRAALEHPFSSERRKRRRNQLARWR